MNLLLSLFTSNNYFLVWAQNIMVEGDPRHKEPTSGCIVGNAYDDYIGICGNLHDIDIPM